MQTQTAASRCKSPYCATLSRAHNSSISAMLGKEVFHGPAALWRLSGLKKMIIFLLYSSAPIEHSQTASEDWQVTLLTVFALRSTEPHSCCHRRWTICPSVGSKFQVFFFFYFSKLSSIKQVQDQFFPLPQSHWQVLSRIPSLSPCSR